MARSSGRSGLPVTSTTMRLPLRQIVWLSASTGSGPMSLSTTMSGIGKSSERADQGAAHDRALGEAGLGEAGLERLERRVLVLLGGAERVALADDLLVGHELLGPLDRAEADEQDREAEAEAEREVRQLHGPDRAERDERVGRDRDVADDEPDGEQRRQAEHGRDLTLGALGGLRVGVGDAVVVRREREQRRVAVLGDRDVRAVGVAHRTFAPIQTAASRSAPMPAVQMNTPSVTGP